MTEQQRYEHDRREADDFYPVQRDLLKKLFNTKDVVVANFRQDTKEVTDVVVDKVFKVSLRIRDYKFYEAFWKEVTLRAGTTNSESAKISRGEGDWMLYGFRTPDGKRHQSWSLLWLPVLHDIGRAIEERGCDPMEWNIKVKDSFGQNSFVCLDVPELVHLGFVTDTSDLRLWTKTANLWTPEADLKVHGGAK